MNRFVFFILSGCITGTALFFTGCGRNDLEGLEGNVTFADQPLQCGAITFVATAIVGRTEASAPPTAAGIKDGKFLIPKKYGLKQGNYRVTIKGLEGVPRGDLPLGREIFPAYDTMFKYTGQTTCDFAVPALKKPLPKPKENATDPSVFIQ